MKTTRPFIGIEAEGPSRGLPTIFIPREGTSSLLSILRFAGNSRINRVYFGAGNQRGLSSVECELAISLAERGFDVICEFDLPQIDTLPIEVLRHIEAVVVLPVAQIERYRNVSVKFVGCESLVWLSSESNSETFLDDPLYKLDMEVGV